MWEAKRSGVETRASRSTRALRDHKKMIEGDGFRRVTTPKMAAVRSGGPAVERSRERGGHVQ